MPLDNAFGLGVSKFLIISLRDITPSNLGFVRDEATHCCVLESYLEDWDTDPLVPCMPPRLPTQTPRINPKDIPNYTRGTHNSCKDTRAVPVYRPIPGIQPTHGNPEDPN